ncbi:hypothetical protein OC845_002585 [Tilletia horrida]|nr:hypothetical protein OC845_002585 [Tilletia horrida]
MASSQQPAPRHKIPVGVVGFGNSSRTFHLPLILSLPDTFTLYAIQQRPESKGEDAARLFPSAKKVPDVDTLLGDGPDGLPKRSLVVITVTNELHVPIAKKALEAGHHVVIEKPMALTSKDAQMLADLSVKLGLVCSAYQNRRFDGDFLTIKSLMAPPKGDESQPPALGIPTYFESRFDRFRPLVKGGWREEVSVAQGGGVLWDLGSHLVDQALTLFGPPAQITAFVHNQRGQLSAELDDEFTLRLAYPPSAPLPPDSFAPGTRLSGLQVVLGASCMSTHLPAEQPRFRVEALNGSYEKRGVDPQEDQLKKGWSPRTHPDAFGIYQADVDPPSLHFGRLTTLPASVTEATSGSAPPLNKGPGSGYVPPLVAADIPTLPGRYIDYYVNIGEAIHASDHASSPAEAAAAVRQTLLVQPSQVVDAIKVLELARVSAKEGRTVNFE